MLFPNAKTTYDLDRNLIKCFNVIFVNTTYVLKKSCMQEGPRVEKGPIAIQFLGTCYCHGCQ